MKLFMDQAEISVLSADGMKKQVLLKKNKYDIFLTKCNIFSQLERNQYATRKVMESQRNWKYISTRTKYALMSIWNILVRHVIPTMNCFLHQYLKN